MFASRKFVAPALFSLLSGTAVLAVIVSGQVTTVGAEDTHWGTTASDRPADTHWSVDLIPRVPSDRI